jgi:Protein of unknown function (DUF1018)
VSLAWNAHQLGQVLDFLNKDGSRTRAKPWVGKIRALWWSLYWIGRVDSGSEASLDRFIERQTGKSKIAFLDARNAHQVIEALKSWAARDQALINGRAPPKIKWPTADDLAEQQRHHPNANIDTAKLERIAVIKALADALDRLGLVSKHAIDRYIAAAVPGKTGSANTIYWTNTELDAAIRVLGKKLRRALDKDPDMACGHFTLPNGSTGIICSRGRGLKKCNCGNVATRDCDWKVKGKRSGTCDAALCARCTFVPAADKDLCPRHAAQWQERLRAADSQRP